VSFVVYLALPWELHKMNPFEQMSREDLLKALQMFAKNWLAHDGCWFLAAERQHGMAEAIQLDAESWAQFAAVEARRIASTFDLPPNGGLQSLEKALALRMYSLINQQRCEWHDGRLRFYMDRCQVQEARRRKGLPDFPCKPVGAVEFSTFARTIDSRISTACLHCPPDAPRGKYCGWEFALSDINS
jgi:Family of unknown function (DUF6125)